MKGLFFVISGPSGAGKTTLRKKIIKEMPDISYSVSLTTRLPRKGEIDGKDYFFISKEEFKKRIKNNEFLEWAVVHDHYYGTPWAFLEKVLDSGKNIILDIDVQGEIKIKKKYPNGIFIFITTPSLAELEKKLKSSSTLSIAELEKKLDVKKRLEKRGKDSEETIKKRLLNATKEIKEIKNYDYVIVNDNLEDAFQELKSVIISKIGRERKNGEKRKV